MRAGSRAVVGPTTQEIEMAESKADQQRAFDALGLDNMSNMIGDDIPKKNLSAVNVVSKWLANARSTKPMDDNDRDEIRKVVRRVYEAKGWPPIFDASVCFAPSPFVALVSSGILSMYWHSQGIVRSTPPKENVDSQCFAFLRDKTQHPGYFIAKSSVYNQLSKHALSLQQLLSNSSLIATDLLGSCIESETSVFDTLTELVTNKASLDSILEICRLGSQDSKGDISTFCASAVVTEAGMQAAIDAMGKSFDCMEGGNLQAGVSAVFDYLDRMGTSLDAKYRPTLELNWLTGPWILHPKFCVVSERPELLELNSKGDLHAEAGPACRWRDGTRLYYLNGIRVDSNAVRDPNTLTAKQLEHMTDSQKVACFDKAPDREQVLFAIHQDDDGIKVHVK